MSYLEEPYRPEKSKGLSIFLWVFGILGLLVVLACGGILLTGFIFFRRATSQDPAEIRAVTREITELRVPDKFEPSISISIQGMKMVVYSKGDPPGSSGTLTLTEVPGGAGPGAVQNGDQQRQEIERSLRGQTPQIGRIDEAKTEERTYMIRGEEQTVTVQHGTRDQGEEWVQANVSFTSKQGNEAIMIYVVPEENWDEDKFEGLLESMQ